MEKPRSARVRGQQGEQLAAQYLRERHGYRILTTNYRCSNGEVDLIAFDGRSLVFVEVKTRSSGNALDALEAVDWNKRCRIRAAAQHFLAHWPLPEVSEVRFDVLVVSGEAKRVEFYLVQGAFQEE